MTPSRQQVCLLIASLWGCVHGFTPANKPPRRTATTALPATRREFAAAAASILTWADTSSAALASSEGNNSPIVMGDERLMAPKAHGTTEAEVQADLLYSVNRQLADKICSFNRRFAEPGGSWEKSPLASVMSKSDGPVTFYDSVTVGLFCFLVEPAEFRMPTLSVTFPPLSRLGRANPSSEPRSVARWRTF